MDYKRLYIDAIPTKSACFFCDRPLKSLTATFLIDKQKNIVVAGPDCAKRESINPDNRIPNLFNDSLYDIKADYSKRSSKLSDQIKIVNDDMDQKAIAYLILRQEKMREFSQIAYDKFVPLYSRYLEGELNGDDIKYIVKVLEYNEEKNINFSYTNLRNCYSIDQLISIAIAGSKKTEYLISIQRHLRSNLKLTSKQIAGLNNWLQGAGIAKIKESIFDR